MLFGFRCIKGILISFLGNLASQTSLKRLLRIWTSRYPDAKMDPMNIWDDIITNRYSYILGLALVLSAC